MGLKPAWEQWVIRLTREQDDELGNPAQLWDRAFLDSFGRQWSSISGPSRRHWDANKLERAEEGVE
jgi:hypothetical protein